MNRFQYILLVLLFSFMPIIAAEPQEILLWPEGAPGATSNTPSEQPTLTLCFPPAETATGVAIVVCPGGGYTHLAIDHEGRQVAEWLNSIGVAAFIVKYRHNVPGGNINLYPIPFQDAQRAVRMVRARAAEWRVDPERVGIMGFSAGGHLASTVGTHFDSGNPLANDLIGRVSSRPNFMILIYPVISLRTQFVHQGSKRALLGENPDLALVEKLSNETQVTAETPPTFLVHATDDGGVPVENTLLFYQALRQAGVPAEMHIYEKGGHGFGMRKNDPILATWIDRLGDWLKVRGLIRE